ncbi:hypothetical protein PHLH6_09350 [Pseudomonas sp. Seg1]|uniref:hypothetical protein n=1 Tax=unclassified Pseudomonas TaxID=196821 RepID=UPI000CD1FDC5|nr:MULTISPECIES: hypothetical protein [unclassified Pseudomonas]POA49196.1 hypothetical protein C1893_06100 [Pseudomonas sp. MPR-ANC1]BBP68931.1 hypothetical protein PHLH6_09350 [Pseudomonas sp. Seg1]
MPDLITPQVRKLAAIGYGEASTDNNPQEVRGICFTVTNRMRAWGLADVASLLKETGDSYIVAARGKNERYNQLMAASEADINADPNMRSAVESARDALAQRGNDPSNGAYWWDGIDIKDSTNPRHSDGFHYGSPSHNIFGVAQVSKPEKITYWKQLNKKTNTMVNVRERGRYNHVYRSTAAIGKTIFWTTNPEYIKATGAKEYR